jgi:hypothetical protein
VSVSCPRPVPACLAVRWRVGARPLTYSPSVPGVPLAAFPQRGPPALPWGSRAGYLPARHHTGASSSTAYGTADPWRLRPKNLGLALQACAWARAAGVVVVVCEPDDPAFVSYETGISKKGRHLLKRARGQPPAPPSAPSLASRSIWGALYSVVTDRLRRTLMARGSEARAATGCTHARWRVPRLPACQPLATNGGHTAHRSCARDSPRYLMISINILY